MGCSHKENPGKNDKTIQGIDKNIHLHVGRHSSKGTPGLHRHSPAGHDVRLHHLAHAKRNSKIKRHLKQTGCHTKQMSKKHSRSLQSNAHSCTRSRDIYTSIDIHLDQLQAQTRQRLCRNGQKSFITNACNKIANKLRGRAGRKRAPVITPGMLKYAWAKRITSEAHNPPTPTPNPPWAESPPNLAREIGEARAAHNKITAQIKKTTHSCMAGLVEIISGTHTRSHPGTIRFTLQKTHQIARNSSQSGERASHSDTLRKDRPSRLPT